MARFSRTTRVVLEVVVTAVFIAYAFYDLWEPTPTIIDLSGAINQAKATSRAYIHPMVAPGVASTTLCGQYWQPPNVSLTVGSASSIAAVIIDTRCSLSQSGYAAYAPTDNNTVITINSGSYLSFANVAPTSLPLYVRGPIIFNSGILEAVFSSSATWNPNVTTTVLLANTSSTTCALPPSQNVVNCPTGGLTGLLAWYFGNLPYTCTWQAQVSGSRCLYSVAVEGPLVADNTTSGYYTLLLNKDCSTFQLSTFVTACYYYLGIPPADLVGLSSYCGSTYVAFQCQAGTPQAATQICSSIVNAATNSSDLFSQYLGVLAGWSNEATPHSPSSTPRSAAASSSNPALFGLLALLAIPVFILIGVAIWMCMKNEPPPTDDSGAPKDMYPMPAPGTTAPVTTPEYSAVPTTGGSVNC